jgi:hypothetical protein
MTSPDVDDINRKLAILAAKHGFAATARETSKDGSRLVFEAFIWRNGELFTHSASFPVSELALLGPVAIAKQFVDDAIANLRQQIG